MKHSVDDFRKEVGSLQGDVLATLFMDLEYPEGTYILLHEVYALLKEIEEILNDGQ